MFSLNVPLPGAVRRVHGDCRAALVAAGATPREDPALVVKRLGEHSHRVEERVRRALADAPAVEARVAGVEVFERPADGREPVLYLAVESPGLRTLHDRLCGVVDPAPGVEGDDYVPHVTLGRTRDPDAALAGLSPEPVAWTVDALAFYDARHGEPAGRVSLG